MQVQVKLFATLARLANGKGSGTSFQVELPENATVNDLIGRLELPRDEVKVVFVNARVRPLDWSLEPGDEVGIFPPIGGG